MKIGVFSDVHSNLEALEAVLNHLRSLGVSHFACCGDIVGYGPDPERCIEILSRLRCPCVAGNHDYGVLGKTGLSEFNPAAAAAVRWTRSRLNENHFLYLDRLPLTAELDRILIVHASPSAPDEWDYLFTLADADAEMRHFAQDICILGHTHIPFVAARAHGQPVSFVRAGHIKLGTNVKYLINAGSVGQPRDGDPRASFLVFDTSELTITFHRVPYDIPRVQDKMRAAGLPEELASRLAAGR